MKINEIFYSIQGEGYHTGQPAIFVRFSGCNLKCPFCDTDHNPGIKMSEDEIVEEVSKYPSHLVILTGGEPTLQITDSLIQKLHHARKTVAIETNGTHEVPLSVDWVTCSPKYAPVVLKYCNELKVVYQGQDMKQYEKIIASHHYLQPCDVKDEEENRENTNAVIEFIKKNPEWRISLQTQKILKVR